MLDMILEGLCSTDFFFFSSRRRHTRLQGDWSSDVCSSDLMIRHTRLQGDWSSDVCYSDLGIFVLRAATAEQQHENAHHKEQQDQRPGRHKVMVACPGQATIDRKSVV